MKMRLAIFGLVSAIAACSPAEQPQGSAPQGEQSAAIESVTGGEIRRHMEMLASDEMQGREAGTEFYARAAEYVVAHYEAAGLRPLGDEGSYFQSIDFFETRLVPDSAQMSLEKDGESTTLVFRDDFIRSGGFGAAEEEITAELVFIGHGIIAPELDHDDFAGVDVNGKILVVLSGAPPMFDTDRRAFYSSGSGKAAVAVEKGAVGMITLRTPVDQERRPWARYLPGVGSPGMRWIDADGSPFEGFPELKGGATVSEAGVLPRRPVVRIRVRDAGV